MAPGSGGGAFATSASRRCSGLVSESLCSVRVFDSRLLCQVPHVYTSRCSLRFAVRCVYMRCRGGVVARVCCEGGYMHLAHLANNRTLETDSGLFRGLITQDSVSFTPSVLLSRRRRACTACVRVKELSLRISLAGALNNNTVSTHNGARAPRPFRNHC